MEICNLINIYIYRDTSFYTGAELNFSTSVVFLNRPNSRGNLQSGLYVLMLLQTLEASQPNVGKTFLTFPLFDPSELQL